MKPKAPLFSLVVLLYSLGYAVSPDNQAIPRPVNQLPLVPLLKVMYFNQTLDFSLPQSSADVIDHVVFNHGWTTVEGKNFTLHINYANAPVAEDELKVFVRKADGSITLACDQHLLIRQKLSEKNFESVANDNNLFKLDGEIQPLDNYASKEKLARANHLDINTARFDQDSIRLQSFDLQLKTANGTQVLHSTTGDITPEMKAAIQTLKDNDSVTFINIMTTYVSNNQSVKLNLNYGVKYIIGTEG